MIEATPAIITIDNLHAAYGSVQALKGVSLQIRQGECFGLLGPNGAGKTTLLSCLEGIKKFHQGSILVNGADVAKETTKVKQMLGIQLQDAALFPDFTAVEIIQFYGALYNVFSTRSQAIDLLKSFDLGDKARSKIEELSGGQRQKLTLALSMVHSPSILLLDEPTTGLDPQARRQIWGIIQKLRREGKTIILTTHYIEEAERLCQHVGIIDKGEIIALGSPQELIQKLGNLSTVLVTIDLSEEKLRELSSERLVSSLSYDQSQLTLQTAEPHQILSLLEKVSGGDGIIPQNTVIRQPSLEDVFLSLTGHALAE